ncbi:MAG: hypothetical protein AAGL66_15390, partial [Pseudomonadota bacterium]
MNRSFSQSRRESLKLALGATGLMLYAPASLFGETKGSESPASLLGLVEIAADNGVILYNPNPELGQGTQTSLPMLLAEELDLDWEQVIVKPMALALKQIGNAKITWAYVGQFSGGSGSMRRQWYPLRILGARLRKAFLQAGSGELGVPIDC